MRLILICAAVGLLVVSFFACTIDVTDNKQPTINVNCIEVILPGGQVQSFCDAGNGDDAGDSGNADGH